MIGIIDAILAVAVGIINPEEKLPLEAEDFLVVLLIIINQLLNLLLYLVGQTDIHPNSPTLAFLKVHLVIRVLNSGIQGVVDLEMMVVAVSVWIIIRDPEGVVQIGETYVEEVEVEPHLLGTVPDLI